MRAEPSQASRTDWSRFTEPNRTGIIIYKKKIPELFFKKSRRFYKKKKCRNFFFLTNSGVFVHKKTPELFFNKVSAFFYIKFHNFIYKHCRNIYLTHMSTGRVKLITKLVIKLTLGVDSWSRLL